MIFYHFGLHSNCVVYLGRFLDFKVTLVFFVIPIDNGNVDVIYKWFYVDVRGWVSAKCLIQICNLHNKGLSNKHSTLCNKVLVSNMITLLIGYQVLAFYQVLQYMNFIKI